MQVVDERAKILRRTRLANVWCVHRSLDLHTRHCHAHVFEFFAL